MSTITIEQTALPVIEIDGRRLVTLAMIDRVHQRPEGTAKRAFSLHRSKLILIEDYLVLTGDEIRTQSLTHVFPPRTPKGILLTESGYLMLVKSFTDDLAWRVQRQLVAGYFRPAGDVQPAAPRPGDEDFFSAMSDAGRLRALLLRYTDRVVALEAQAKADAPKVAFHEAIVNAVNCQSVQEVAKVLGTGPNRLFRFLRDEGLLMANNLPYQQHVDAGHFRVVERQWRDDRGETHSYARTLVTGKGLAYIQRRLASLKTPGSLFAQPQATLGHEADALDAAALDVRPPEALLN